MKKVLKDIFDDILEISDIKMQKKLWLNEDNDTGLISSYVELMNRLFDDNNFDYFIENEALVLGLESKLIVALETLRDALDDYVEKETDQGIITDPKWIEISKQAKSIIEMWPS